MVTIRPRTAADLDGCVDLIRLVYAHSGYLVQGTDNAKAFLSGGSIEQAWIAEHDDQIVGHVAVSKATEDDVSVALWRKQHPNDPIAMLERLFVHPEKLGGGIATQLIQTATARSRESGRRLVLFALIKDQAAIRLYERQGWTSFDSFKTNKATSKMFSIGVIGAGAAGLAAAKYLLAEGFEVTMLERKGGAGGVWNTAPGNGYWPSPVYDGLETNVPRTLMTFSDSPWPTDASLFPTSSTVKAYLQAYLDQLKTSDCYSSNLRVEFNAEVTEVRHMTTKTKKPFWKVKFLRHHFGQTPTEWAHAFDAVVVAIGNYHKHFSPKALLDLFSEWDQAYPESLLHAVRYRNPDSFAGKTVLVVGNSASGWDISSQLARTAQTVFVSSRRFTPQSTQQALSAPTHVGMPGIQSVDAATRSVTFVDGKVASNIDNVIFCTGYAYDFEFIKQGTVTPFGAGLRVSNVYEHIFWTVDQSLAFVGLPKMSAAFNVAEAQSAVVARLWSGRIKIWMRPMLQKWEEHAMLDFEEQMHAGRQGPSDFHSFMLATDRNYVNRLLDWSMQAEGTTSFGDEGQPPPYWCSCIDKARDQSKGVRNAFKAHGATRHQYTTHQSLGFQLTGPCIDGVNKLVAEKHRCRSCFI
ncbi:hypothetical protein LTR85_011930 [Meristemomyces frigidus]|nr:hypothetical protein LTR85_011930 [Meristemomyces frigidus]